MGDKYGDRFWNMSQPLDSPLLAVSVPCSSPFPHSFIPPCSALPPSSPYHKLTYSSGCSNVWQNLGSAATSFGNASKIAAN